MVIAVNPVIVSAGSVALRWYAVFALLGLALGAWMTVRGARARGVSSETVKTSAAWAVPVGLVSAHLVYLIGGWEYAVTRPEVVWRFSLDGLSIWGGIVGGGLAAAWALRRHPWARARLADAAAPGLALGIAVGRIGSFVDGAGQGVPTSLPWGTQYTSPATSAPDFGVPRHPAQAYDGLLALAAFGLISLVPRSAPAGTRLWAFLAIYGVARVALGAVMLEAPFLLGVQLDQLLAGAAVVFAALQALKALRAGPTGAQTEGAGA